MDCKDSITAERRSVTCLVWRVRGRADSNESYLSRIAIDALGSHHEEADSRMFSHNAYAMGTYRYQKGLLSGALTLTSQQFAQE